MLECIRMLISDLHIHSRYSRACSRELTLPNIAAVCEKKGIDLVSTGDFTHPAWFSHIKEELTEVSAGIFSLRAHQSKTRFILGTEISCIYKQNEKVRRIHLCIFAPSFFAVDKFNRALEERGCNIHSDGRPIIGLSAKEVLKILLDVSSEGVMIPAHAWTPWFSVFGSKSGFDSLDECFEELTPQIFAIETGLSSDPKMNWRISGLDNISLVSNSDAHGLENLGREANVLNTDFAHLTYNSFFNIIKRRNPKEFLHTIEFFPEEGKYHLDGHADCGVVFTPEETKKQKGLCPKCGKPLVIGVMHRVDNLADKSEKDVYMVPAGRVPYKSIVPLKEVIGNALGKNKTTKIVGAMYEKILKELGSEFHILLDAELNDVAVAGTPEISEAVSRMRAGELHIEPGYDGLYGKVKIFSDEDRPRRAAQQNLL
ncbi:MAG: DNA and RNA helicase [Candidatus Magasanikbacteria bacterium]|nr:DNA and RNA helicase [Candidatus Magasanikbacteria bacterium]